MTILYILFGLLCLVIAISLIWRLLSERWSIPCPDWLGWMIDRDNPFTKANQGAIIISRLELSFGMKVLDAGCGTGRLTLPLAKAVGPEGKVLTLDIQEGMLSAVRKKVKAAELENVDFLQAGLGEGKLPIDLFDRALLVTVLGEIPDPLPALQEIFRALKPGGILSVTEVIFDPHFQSQTKVLHLANQAGFKMKECFGRKLAYTMLFEKVTSNALLR